jgi:hydrogenase maturation protein HypF
MQAFPGGSRRRVEMRLRGIVQGVGFRPFVYRLAAELRLGGYVLNSAAGLVAEVEGEANAVDEFLRLVRADAPPLAWVQEMRVAELGLRGEEGFAIRPSGGPTADFALISPDIATCEECRAEFLDPNARRFQYPFTNCTNCGPRYTIIRDIPYDRPNTTMAAFEMCADCRQEYENPGDRRFHAQPIACPACGPALSAPIEEARRRLAAGEIVAIKGLGGFHLACDARNGDAVERLRRRKRRSDKPFALMTADLEAAERICVISAGERDLLTSPRRPIVILDRRPDSGLPEAIAPGNHTLGVMLPYTPLHDLLFTGAPYAALVMTSGNISEEPIVTDNAEACERLNGVADWFLFHNRDIFMRTDDSVVREFEGTERTLRRSRGCAPQVLDLPWLAPELLACGAELKNAFCLTKANHAILSQHIGDMENYETLVFFEETLANLKKLFRVNPRVVVHDLHPAYLTTRYAQGLENVETIAVQHHHAHIASCMAENGLEGEVLGVAFDGTGYGTDGAIWGGEFLQGSYQGFERRAHLRYVPLAGGDAAVREPWRSALSYLVDTFGADVAFDGAAEERVRVVRRMIARGVNTVPTSSCGRLFDAVASLTGLRNEVTFEGQAAIELEAVAAEGIPERYGFGFATNGAEIDLREAIEGITGDRGNGTPLPVISAKFHNTVAEVIVEACARMRRGSGLTRVCLSGGTFQNVKLLRGTLAGLRTCGFEVFLHSKVPPNDGGIALGQAAIAAARLKGG